MRTANQQKHIAKRRMQQGKVKRQLGEHEPGEARRSAGDLKVQKQSLPAASHDFGEKNSPAKSNGVAYRDWP
jgi:hypothetical protein